MLIAHPALPEKHPQVFKYGRCPLVDDPNFNLLELLPDALGFLAKARGANGVVFVYCAKGISRSSSIVMALLMLERRIGFEDAFKVCEQRRPIVYPNVGFQQQLRHLESLLATVVDRSADLQVQVDQLRTAVPRGSLQTPRSPLHINEAIGASMDEALDALESLVEKVCAQPQLLQQRELWKRHGLFFENLHKYKALPAAPELLGRARSAATRLRSLPKIFSDSLKGVKLAQAVAKELEAWASFAEPLLSKPKVEEAPPGEPPGPPEKDEDSASSSSSSDERKAKKKEAGAKDKKSKKEKKIAKKIKKAAKKMKKVAAKMDKAAREAELAADDSLRQAEQAAERAEQLEAKLAEIEAEEAFEEKAAAVAARAAIGKPQPTPRSPKSRSASSGEGPGRSEGGSGSDSEASSAPPAARRRLV